MPHMWILSIMRKPDLTRPPLFTRINTTKKTGIKINMLQNSFEKFCASVIGRCPDNNQREVAIQKMQEACIWFCRSIAMRDFTPPEIKNEIRKELTLEEMEEIKLDEEAIKKANQITTSILVKKSKIQLIKK